MSIKSTEGKQIREHHPRRRGFGMILKKLSTVKAALSSAVLVVPKIADQCVKEANKMVIEKTVVRPSYTFEGNIH